jgi:hypothetical protein
MRTIVPFLFEVPIMAATYPGDGGPSSVKLAAISSNGTYYAIDPTKIFGSKKAVPGRKLSHPESFGELPSIPLIPTMSWLRLPMGR